MISKPEGFALPDFIKEDLENTLEELIPTNYGNTTFEPISDNNTCRCSCKLKAHGPLRGPNGNLKCRNKSCINKCKGFIPSSGKRKAQLEERKLQHKLAGIKYNKF